MQKYLWIAIGGSLGVIGSILGWRNNRRSSGDQIPLRHVRDQHYSLCDHRLLSGFSGQRTELNPAWRFLIPVGFVGAYSTFSTFEWEIFSTLQTGGLSDRRHCMLF